MGGALASLCPTVLSRNPYALWRAAYFAGLGPCCWSRPKPLHIVPVGGFGCNCTLADQSYREAYKRTGTRFVVVEVEERKDRDKGTTVATRSCALRWTVILDDDDLR